MSLWLDPEITQADDIHEKEVGFTGLFNLYNKIWMLDIEYTYKVKWTNKDKIRMGVSPEISL